MVLYSGNIGYLREFDTIIAAAEYLAKEGMEKIVFFLLEKG